MMSRAAVHCEANVAGIAADTAVVRRWLWSVAGLILIMITIGGATRLTGSGLSITEWQPIMGAIPPLSGADWQVAFAKYQAIPQYTQVNKGMGLEAFKVIFWWEWGHRFLGRLIGVAYALPLTWFWLRGLVPARSKLPLLGLLALGGLQGFIGWFMVQSGLSGRIDVSQYRLALHLGMAFALLGGIVWIALDLAPHAPRDRRSDDSNGWSVVAAALVGLIFLQVITGAFVAGLKAGLTYNTWPLMDGRLIPVGLGTLTPWYRNPFENITAVQFNHRLLAYAICTAVLWHAARVYHRTEDAELRRSALLLAIAVTAQVVLGIWTLVWVVPIPLALAHQGLAAILFVIAVRHWQLVRSAAPTMVTDILDNLKPRQASA